MQLDTSIFKSYDIRGVYPDQLDADLAEKVARGFAKYLDFPEQVIVARDGRISGPELHDRVIEGLTKVGINVIDIGMASTDMYYYACQMKGLPGISVTASHNPKEYNGFKMVKKIPQLLSGDEGIGQIRDYILNDDLPADTEKTGQVEKWDVLEEFIDYCLQQVDVSSFKKIQIHVDTANGMVGPILEVLDKKLPTITLKPMYWEIDGTFPNHGGDPLQEENRRELQELMPDSGSEVGCMFDPDGDRFFVIDNKGRFISGDFMTAILSKNFLEKYPGAKIVYDIRASQVVPNTIEANGGEPLANRVGHTHIKKRMSEEGAVFGGEVSGHYYYKDFFLCDTGLLSLLYLIEFLSSTPKSLDQIVDEMEAQYHISGEINSEVDDVQAKIDEIEKVYSPLAVEPVNKIDGVTLEMGDWRFNVRGSNTEPKIRLNLEAKTQELMQEKRDEVLAVIRS